MIHFVVHDERDSVGVVVVERVNSGQQLSGWIMDQDKQIRVSVQDDIPIGHKLAIAKLAANDTVIKYGTDIGRTLSGHIDVDVSGLLRREMTQDEAGDALLDCMFRTVNGRLTAAEALGHREFVLTRLYESA